MMLSATRGFPQESFCKLGYTKISIAEYRSVFLNRISKPCPELVEGYTIHRTVSIHPTKKREAIQYANIVSFKNSLNVLLEGVP